MGNLQVISGGPTGLVFPLEGERVTIGRGLDNLVRIDDQSVSRHHAVLVLDNGGYKILDLGSQNGTCVNGARILERALHAGDQIRLGLVELRFDANQTSPASAKAEPAVPPLKPAPLTIPPAPAAARPEPVTRTPPSAAPASSPPPLSTEKTAPVETPATAPAKAVAPAREQRNRDELRALLLQTGLLSEARVEELLQARAASSESVVAMVLKSGVVPEEKFLTALAKVMNLPFTRLPDTEVDVAARVKVSTKVVFQYNIMPARVENGTLLVATSDPFNLAMIESVRLVSRCRVKLMLSTQADILKALKRYYGVGAETLDELMSKDVVDIDVAAPITKEDLENPDQEASVVKFVNQIIWEAFRERATDIHVEPMENDLRIRYRVDGVLHQTPVPAQLKRFQAAIISRVKVMANMDIAEKRLPQDGRINVRSGGEEIDVRVSTIPTAYGESVSLRLLTRSSIVLGLERLGLSADDQQLIRRLIELPHGIILVTGPTGSGKSTSLYAFLSTINSIDQRIITVEDPIEYELAGVNQIQVKPEIGLTFASGLRHILRQDPDIIMVGEIRDLETAEIAIRAALTGHLVFSTLHTNDAAGAITRLLDMGIEPFLVSSSIEAIIAQRLVRTICAACKEEYAPGRELLRDLAFPEEDIETTRFFRGRGCEDCRFTGFKGRLGIFEILTMSEALRPLIIERTSSTTIKQSACARGMKTLREDGWHKVKLGLTTVEEVARVTQEDEELAGT
jgi:general secretion pathway protein E